MTALVLWLALAAAPARADDISPPPVTCPPGSIGESSHLGEWCQPHRCTDDGMCGPGKVCREAGLCIRVDSGSMGPHHGNLPYRREIVEGTGACDACAAPRTCETGRYCQPTDHVASPTATKAPPPSGGPPQPMDRVIVRGVDEDDGCRVGSGARAAGSLGGLGAGALVVLGARGLSRRRRDRPRR